MRPTAYCKGLSTTVAKRLNISPSRVEEIVRAYNSQIRYLPATTKEEKKASLMLIMTTIAQVARDYGANVAIEPETYEECVRLVISKFSYLALGEIRAAYRMMSAGEISAKGAEMYGGKFNAAQLGKTLAAYSANRKPILGNYLRLKEEKTFEEKKAARDYRLQNSFDATFSSKIEQAKSTFTTFEQVPEFWYHSALKRKLFSLTSEEGIEIKALADKVTVLISQRERSSDLLAAMRPPGSFESRSKVIARKIAVWEKLIRGDDRERAKTGADPPRHKSASQIYKEMQACQTARAAEDIK